MMAFVGVLGFASCEDDVDYNPAAPVNDSKTQVFFDANSPVELESPYKDDHFVIKVLRHGAGEAFDASISCKIANPDLADYLKIPTVVSFAKDATEADLKIGVSVAEGNEYPAGVPVEIQLELTDADYTYEYGSTKYTFTYRREAPFKPMGKGVYTDDIFASAFGQPIETYEVQVDQSILNENIYRLSNVYSADGPFWSTQFAGALADAGAPNATSASIVIDCTNPAEVRIERSELGMSLNGQLFSGPDKMCPTIVGMVRDLFKDQANAPVGKIENGVISFPAQSVGLIIDGIGGMAVNASGKMRIVLPGAEIPTPAPECNVSYAGVFTDAKNVTSAVLNFDFNDQVSACRVAVVKAEKVADEAAKQKKYEEIKADEKGQISTKVEKSGQVAMTIHSNGNYVALVVVYGLDGKALDTVECEFTIEGGNMEPVAMKDFYGDYTMNSVSVIGQAELPATPVKIEAYKEAESLVKITGLVHPLLLEKFIGAKPEGFFIARFDADMGAIYLETDLLYKEVGGELKPVQWDVNAGTDKPAEMCDAGLAFGVFDQKSSSFSFMPTSLGFNAEKKLILKGEAQQFYPGFFQVSENTMNLVSLAPDISKIVLTRTGAQKKAANTYAVAPMFSKLFALASAQEVKTVESDFVQFSVVELPANAQVKRVFNIIKL